MKRLSVLIMLLAGTLGLAEPPQGWPTLKAAGREYHDVKVVSRDAGSIKILHTAGVARILMKDLPEEIRVAFGYDPEKAAQTLEKQDQEKKLEVLKLEQAEFLKNHRLAFAGTVSQVQKDGVLLKGVTWSDGSKIEVLEPYYVKNTGPNGLHPNDPVTYVTRYNSKWELDWRTFGGDFVYVYCPTGGIVDGVDFKDAVYPFDTYSYLDLDGARRTIRAFTTSGRDFLKRKEEPREQD